MPRGVFGRRVRTRQVSRPDLSQQRDVCGREVRLSTWVPGHRLLGGHLYVYHLHERRHVRGGSVSLYAWIHRAVLSPAGRSKTTVMTLIDVDET